MFVFICSCFLKTCCFEFCNYFEFYCLHSIVALNFVVIFNRNKNGEEEDFVRNFFLLI